MVGAIVVTLVVTLPAVYFVIGWQSRSEHLTAQAEVYAGQVSEVINRNPEMWKYETIRLEGLLAKPLSGISAESCRVLDQEGNVVAQQKAELPWPVMTRAQKVLDSGVSAGSLEVSESLRPLVVETVVLGVIGTALGTALFFLLRKYPMSALDSALETLVREKGRARVTLYSIGDGVISTDTDDRVVLVNRVAESLVGWTQGEAAGKPVEEIYRKEGGILVSRDGSRRTIEESISPILDEKGRSLGSVFVFRDATEKLRTEAELLKAQKLESLGILAAGIAHEIRNPLSAVSISTSSITHLCERSEGLEPEWREKILVIVEQMKAATSKMASIVQRVMEFSRPSPPRMALVNLNEPIEEAIRLSTTTLRKQGIVVNKDLSPGLPECRADARLIEQVLVNLMTNACQAMEGIEGEKRLEIASFVEDGRIVIRVADSGPGIAASIREKIFDPFFTTRKDGSGIGLSFSHRIVADHGGTLRANTSRWGGAEFRIGLPGPSGGAT
jgi:signal transduction histidine kinase